MNDLAVQHDAEHDGLAEQANEWADAGYFAPDIADLDGECLEALSLLAQGRSLPFEWTPKVGKRMWARIIERHLVGTGAEE